MRQRSVNEKAVKKLIAYLSDLQKDLDNEIFVTGHVLQTKHGVSKSTYSVCKKLKIVTDDQKWNVSFVPDRLTAIKILEFLRQQSDKQTDKPISDMWVSEISIIKKLLTDIRDKSKSDIDISRLKIICSIANGVYSNCTHFILSSNDNASINETNDFIIKAANDLFLKSK